MVPPTSLPKFFHLYISLLFLSQASKMSCLLSKSKSLLPFQKHLLNSSFLFFYHQTSCKQQSMSSAFSFLPYHSHPLNCGSASSLLKFSFPESSNYQWYSLKLFFLIFPRLDRIIQLIFDYFWPPWLLLP